ncbi:MAG: YbaK/EbsC family protein [Gammaproteobacteria bacterium]|nr:YbaK/EbsC family protein [Gammaproteobacteria bacterium]NIR84939.1 YbaK/EbsC family protein [Gammaproteobacteria bacterium]NIR91788.1 YbaK/EbsC family protein [Gammaproteobacteria bacterium]NIU05986.1 YbaK/EbsC family protein [Gammaproteobacteria bacterium]NIV53033.1 YbaK/EbsC family protein [Gammaproteobacteria bacterium]
MSAKKSGVDRVRDALAALGLRCDVLELPDSTRTAPEAARAVGCELGQIVKSLVFRGKETGRPILVAASGSNRVDEARVSAAVSEPVEKADAAFVRANTGFAIGGVPPLAHAEPMALFMDRELLQYPDIWAAAGSPRAVFRLTPQELQRTGNWRVLEVV